MYREYFVYILASQRNGTLYIGVTNDLKTRISQHKANEGSKFTRRYQVHRLVYFEVFHDINEAIIREKQLKKWHHKWKLELIERVNPRWEELYPKPV